MMEGETVSTIRVDSDRCQGHAMCVTQAPSLVDVDDLGFAVIIGDGTLSTPEHHEQAERAVACCPEQALHVEDES